MQQAGPAISPFALRAKSDTSVVVVWRLAGGAKFWAGDGPEWINLSSSLAQAISESWAVEDDWGLKGPSSLSSTTRFRVRLQTAPVGTPQNWTYKLKFHDANGNPVVCDPFINNSGG